MQLFESMPNSTVAQCLLLDCCASAGRWVTWSFKGLLSRAFRSDFGILSPLSLGFLHVVDPEIPLMHFTPLPAVFTGLCGVESAASGGLLDVIPLRSFSFRSI